MRSRVGVSESRGPSLTIWLLGFLRTLTGFGSLASTSRKCLGTVPSKSTQSTGRDLHAHPRRACQLVPHSCERVTASGLFPSDLAGVQ